MNIANIVTKGHTTQHASMLDIKKLNWDIGPNMHIANLENAHIKKTKDLIIIVCLKK